MKKIFIPLITLSSLFLTHPYSYSQFNSQFEESVFQQFQKDSANTYDLLNAVNYSELLYVKGKKLINAHINSLKSQNLQSKSLKKQIQTIYKTTHSKFFNKYEAEAYFNNIFENGNYNCVTASALYAIIFDEFNINYAIKETPTHVYLIADTSNLQTLIESTLPGTGVVSYNEKFKKEYIEYLNSNKIISDKEYKTSTTEELFRIYYSKDKSINLKQLAALQYSNKGIFLMIDGKFIGAISYLKKALIIYPSNSIKYNHYAALQNALVNDNNSKTYDGKLYGQIIESSSEDSSLIQLMLNYFDNISAELCIKSPDIERYNSFFQDILSKCSVSSIPTDILHKYYYYRAYYYGITGNYPLALSEIKKAYLIVPDNLMVKELAQQFGMKYMFLESNYKKQIDSLEHYFEELPLLLENRLFQQQYVYYYMKVISECFMYNEAKEGEIYYNRFIAGIDKYNIQYYSDDHISIGIGSMAFYMADEEYFSEALKIINKGLELAPESLRLKQLKVEINNSKQMDYNYKQYVARNNDPDVVYLNSDTETPYALGEKVNEYFPGKWKAVSIIMEEMEQELTNKEIFSFVAEKNKDCTFTQNDKTEKGKWAYRIKSKCIYFVPDYDKDKYKVFKVKEMSADKIVLLPYKDQSNPSPYKYVLKPMN